MQWPRVNLSLFLSIICVELICASIESDEQNIVIFQPLRATHIGIMLVINERNLKERVARRVAENWDTYPRSASFN